jgi:myo-inositol 2-dehydrogenase / D-chiro-inositol 1-dehydrogenase
VGVETSSNSTVVRVGVVGAGLMGAVHAANLRWRTPGAELVAVADFDQARAADVAASLGVSHLASGDEVINDDRVDAVVIASTDDTHAHFAAACFWAGKPVLCEKPLATSATEAWAIVEHEVALGRRLLQVGFMREFDETHAAVRDAVTEGRLGRPVMFRGTHINPFYGWTADVERAITQSIIHDIHSARFLMRSEIVEVYATQVSHEAAADATRFVTVSLTFHSGAVGLLDLNMDSGYGYAVAAEVVGTVGTARTVDPTTLDVRSERGRQLDIMPGWAARFGPAYLVEVGSWIDSVRSGVPVGPSAYDGYVANVVADACVTSVRERRPVAVEVLSRPALYAS